MGSYVCERGGKISSRREKRRSHDYRHISRATDDPAGRRPRAGSATIPMISTYTTLIIFSWHLRVLGDGVAG